MYNCAKIRCQGARSSNVGSPFTAGPLKLTVSLEMAHRLPLYWHRYKRRQPGISGLPVVCPKTGVRRPVRPDTLVQRRGPGLGSSAATVSPCGFIFGQKVLLGGVIEVMGLSPNGGMGMNPVANPKFRFINQGSSNLPAYLR